MIAPVWGYQWGVTDKPVKRRYPPARPLRDTTIRSLKPREKACKVSDFEGLFIAAKPQGRFVRQPPKPPHVPTAVWINPAKNTAEIQT